MSPRALTEQEKNRQYKKLLERGMDIVISQGVKKVSIEDITKAAGMSKGLFYQHFESKEHFMIAVIMDIHEQIMSIAGKILMNGGDLRGNARNLLLNLFKMPEMAFFNKYHNEINELAQSLPENQLYSAEMMEVNMYRKLLIAAGIDVQKIKPGVVHNFIHIMYMINNSDLMTKEELPKTCELIIESLIYYIFGGA
ncbi:MAG: TetR/AcrR family transcriptional regulator [Defluviitaleaceae bacterium]|nr:TetR/AcrR family transcriptional regulator [Defluviitaleaceae bacterium]